VILYHTTVFVASGVKGTNIDFDMGIMSVDKDLIVHQNL